MVVALGAAACAGPGPNVYAPDEAMRLAQVQEGVVVALRPVEIAGDQSPLLGAGVGAVLGGLAGNAISDHGAGGTVLGALAGGVAGAVIENQATKEHGEEITVRLDGGSTVAVVQKAGQGLRVGDRVRLVSEGGRTRLQRA